MKRGRAPSHFRPWSTPAQRDDSQRARRRGDGSRAWCFRRALGWGSLGLLTCALGCGGHPSTAVLDASALLERYEQARLRHDPAHYSETDLGEFTVTKRPDPQDPAIYFIRFHLYAVVADDQNAEFAELMLTHGERVRSKIRETVQSSDVDQLQDPDLGWLKSELIQSVNRSVNTPIVRNVVFAEFSFERG